MKTRVLHIIGSFNQGGSERQAVQLVRMLKDEGSCEVFVACLDNRGILRKEVEQLGLLDIPAFPLNSFYDANMLRQIRRCVRFISENKLVIIQSHDYYTNVFGIIAGTLANVKVRIAAKRDTGTKTPMQLFLEKRAFAMAHSIVANSNAVKNYLTGAGVPEKKITIIYNGVDFQHIERMEADREELLQNLTLPNDNKKQFVTIVANFRSSVKNHRMFLRAAQKIKNRLPNVAFILAGEGELLDEMKAFALELGLNRETFFIGPCSSVGELFAVSDVCALSSWSEGFSNSILEYMAAGKPVVATRVGGAAEAIVEGETGYLVESDDDETMAQRIIELLKNPEKARRFGDRGMRIAEDKFTPAAQLSSTLELYNGLLAKKA